MKLIIYSKIGYNHPSQANWSYGIYKVDTIDTDSKYCMSYTVKESFGGDSRFRQALEAVGINPIETKGVWTIKGMPKIAGVSKMQDMEDVAFINEIINFINK